MEAIRLLFRSIVALLLSVICIGGATAIAIVATVGGNADVFPYAIAGSVALTLLGGWIALLASPYHTSIKFSGGISGLSFAFSRQERTTHSDEKENLIRRQSVIASLFAALTLLVASIIAIGGGIAVIIVANAQSDPLRLPNGYMAMIGGFIQCLFGGYLAMMATGSRPTVKASGDLQEGLSLELTDTPPPRD